MLFIGPMDISQSLGYPGDPAHPEVQQVVRQVIDTCNKYGIAMAFCGLRLFHH